MKLPHVTVEFREEGTFALGKMSWPLIVGFAVHWAWIYFMFADLGSLGLEMPSSVRSIGLLVSMSALSLTLFCYGIFLKGMRKLFAGPVQRKKIRTGGAIATCAGTALFWACAFVSSAALPLVVISGVLTGVGSAILLMSYGVSFSVVDIATAAFSTALSLLLSPFIYLAVAAVLQAGFIAGAIVYFALPFIELICLNRSSAQLVDKLQFNSITIPVRPVPFFVHVFLPGLVFGYIIGIVRTFVLIGAHRQVELASYSQAFTLAAIFTSVLIVAAILTQRQTNNFMFRTLLPVAAFLISSLYFISDNAFYAIFALAGSYLILEACFWVFLADISQRFRISAFTVFGFGRGSFTVGSIVSYLFMLNQPAVPLLNAENFGALAAIAFVACVLGYSFLPKNSELRDTLKLNAGCMTLWDINEEPLAALPMNVQVAQGETAAQQASEARREAVSVGETASAPDEGGAAVAAAVVAPEASEAQMAHAPEHDEQRMQALNDVEKRVEANEEAKRQHVGHFKKKCAAVADTYLLSRKETEVLFLLAKGKNSATIQEQLYISAGTANTHMRRIYRKLNVHSQQELIKLVEAVDVFD